MNLRTGCTKKQNHICEDIPQLVRSRGLRLLSQMAWTSGVHARQFPRDDICNNVLTLIVMQRSSTVDEVFTMALGSDQFMLITDAVFSTFSAIHKRCTTRPTWIISSNCVVFNLHLHKHKRTKTNTQKTTRFS